MYYLKYRPRTIEEIDNSRVKQTFQHILEQKEIPHAFLFVGQKGTGKTSMARIFAKAINCEANAFAGKNKSYEPCNTCTTCLSIESSSSPDVLELDAASNRGIEDVKNLIRETAFVPMSGRYRTFIIDEAHMITTDAFNALLKTLEEPPKQVVFILATTNLEKIPKTIVSRCINVNFGKAKKSDIRHMLDRIVSKEKLNVEPEVLELVASNSDSSFRDGSKLLEELITQNKKDAESAKAYLGLARTNLLTILEKEDVTHTLNWIQEFHEANGNVKILIENLLSSLHEALLKKNGVTVEEAEDVSFTSSEIVRLMKLLTEAYSQLRVTPVECIPLEIAVLEFYNERKLTNHVT